jgi:sugar phosphate isomerase/epimerase
MSSSRRRFIINAATVATGIAIAPKLFAKEFAGKKFFEVSLAQWSLHKDLFSKKIDTLDFPVIARKEFNIGVVEYVNQFFKDKANDKTYLKELLKRCKDNGVKNHLIMVDREGDLGNRDQKERMQAVDNHKKWVDAAKFLGCQTIRVNAFGVGSREDVQKAAVDGLSRLAEFASTAGLNVIVENHGSYTSDGNWLLATIKKVNKKNVGILPDFGNFCVKRDSVELYQGKCAEEYDKYIGVKQWMPYAKGVSAKTIDFDANGNCVETDYVKMMGIIKKSGWTGYMGIEYEGDKLSEYDGIRATQSLLEKVTNQLA